MFFEKKSLHCMHIQNSHVSIEASFFSGQGTCDCDVLKYKYKPMGCVSACMQSIPAGALFLD